MLNRIKKSATFADLEDAVWDMDNTLSWPRTVLSKQQLKGELQNALRTLRIIKRGLNEAIASGNPTRISAWARQRAMHTVEAFVTRERFHRPTTYLRAGR